MVSTMRSIGRMPAVALFFCLWWWPLVGGATIHVEEEYGASPFPIPYADIPWVPTAEQACELAFASRVQSWPPPEWEIVKGSPFVHFFPNASEGSCAMSRLKNGEDWGSEAGIVYKRLAACPPNSYAGAAAGECECNHGYAEVRNSCEPLPPAEPPETPGTPQPPEQPGHKEPWYPSNPPPENCPRSDYQGQGGSSTPTQSFWPPRKSTSQRRTMSTIHRTR